MPSTKPQISSARSAVTPATGSVAACAKLTPSGSSARFARRHRHALRPGAVAHDPDDARARRRAAAVGGGALRTTPATSQPGTDPGGRSGSWRDSPRFSENAWTADERLRRQRLGVGDLAERDVRGLGRSR